MANFPPIQFKRTNVAGRAPTDSDILIGELAINLKDRVIFTKNDSDKIVRLGFTPEYDSDIKKLRHDYKAADSDIAASYELIVDHDSDIARLKHDFAAADSDLQAGSNVDSDLRLLRENDSDQQTQINNIDSDLTNLKVSSLLDVAPIKPTSGETLVWDSDSELWKPGKASTVGSINDLTDVDTVSQVPTHGNTLVWDSDSELWKPGIATNASKISQLLDVDLTGLKNGMSLSWDSDSELWKAGLNAASVLYVEEFIATAGQTQFVLARTPNSDIAFYRNSAFIAIAATTDSEGTITYNPAANNNQIMQAGDRINVHYTASTIIIPAKTLNSITFQDISGPVDGGGAAG